MNHMLVSGLDRGSVAEAYRELEGCLYDGNELQLDEVKEGHKFRLYIESSGKSHITIHKIYLIGTKMLVLCEERETQQKEDGYSFDVDVGHVDPESLQLITYVFNQTRNEVTDQGIHYITHEGMYLHRLLIEQREKKEFEWSWPWEWDLSGILCP